MCFVNNVLKSEEKIKVFFDRSTTLMNTKKQQFYVKIWDLRVGGGGGGDVRKLMVRTYFKAPKLSLKRV